MDALIKMLDPNLELEEYEIIGDEIYLYVHSTLTEVPCPYCKTLSTNEHSHYIRSFKDLPIQGKKAIIVIDNRKMFCKNPKCSTKTFAERFDIISYKAKKSKRLDDEIISISTNVSSLAAVRILRKNIANVGKSTICNILKKKRETQ